MHFTQHLSDARPEDDLQIKDKTQVEPIKERSWIENAFSFLLNSCGKVQK